jgi:hypothetical protein
MTKCQQCEKRACYGIVKVVACGKHREEDMINLYAKKCLFASCDTRPNFGFPNDTLASYCKTHADKGMVNIISKRCLVESCNTRPSFGLPSDKSASYCKSHASEEMVDLRNKKCLVASCNKQKIFGLPSASYCKTHASKEMVNIISKRCLFESCNKIPIFGLPNNTSASYCKTHASEEMINIKSKKCLFKSCNKNPNFGLPNDISASYCKTHASEEMVNIISKKCLFKSCNKNPNFGLPNDTSASYCKTHSLEGMVNIISKKCRLCDLTQSQTKTGYCSPCFYYLNPEHIKTKRHKTRENTFMFQLKEIYPEIILDKVVAGGCSRKRPDGLIDLLTHSIIIEIDEDQHRGYSCENKRSMQLFTDLGSRPIIFIRLNPDSYTLNGKRMRGCFSLSKSSGELIPNDKEISSRFNSLLETIDKCRPVPDKEVSVIELYFNENC